MIFAGMDGGLPCTVGKYVNFDNKPNAKNYISFGGQSAGCRLQQFEVRASGEKGYYVNYFDDSLSRNTAYIEMYYKAEDALTTLSTSFLTIGSGKTNRSFLEFDAFTALFRKIYNYNGGYTSMEHDNQGTLGVHIVTRQSSGGCILRPAEGSFYGYVRSNGDNFALLDGSIGSISAGVDTKGPQLNTSNSAFAQMGQLNNGYVGFYVQSFYNQLSWMLNPFSDEVQFYLANNRQNCRVGFTVTANEASIWAYNTSKADGANFLWDGFASGTLNLYSRNNSLQFYPLEGSFWGYNGTSQNQIKFNMATGLLQLWNSTNRYIDLNLYMLESGTAATFHYVYSGRDKNGNLIPAKDDRGRNIKILSTAPIILSNINTNSICAISYGGA